MTTPEAMEVLADIFANSEAEHKVTVTYNVITRGVRIEYADLDEEWFEELRQAL